MAESERDKAIRKQLANIKASDLPDLPEMPDMPNLQDERNTGTPDTDVDQVDSEQSPMAGETVLLNGMTLDDLKVELGDFIRQS